MINIFKTFEIFLREPLSLFKNGFVKIAHIQDNIFSKQTSLNIDLTKTNAQITVVNNEKVYNLLKLVTYRVKAKENENLLVKR